MPILRDATDSEAVNSLSVHAERFFWRLLQKCDDYGRFHADPILLTSMLFPLKRDARDTDQFRSLQECERAGLVRCYVDRQGRKLLQVIKWRDGKKFKKSAFDPPDGQAHLDLTLPVNGKKSPAPKEVEVEVEGKEKGAPPAKRPRETWQLLKDEAALTDRLKHEAASCKPDLRLLESLKHQRRQVRDEMRLCSHSL